MKRKFLVIYFVIVIAAFAIFMAIIVSRQMKEESRKNECMGRGQVWDAELKACIPIGKPDPQHVEDFIWSAGYDTTLRWVYLRKGSKLNRYTTSPEILIELLNRRPAGCKIEKVGQSADTLFLRILHDEYLNEQMGAIGALAFLGETVLTLAENDRIRHINIDIGRDDHRLAGVYQPADFEMMILDSLLKELPVQEYDTLSMDY